MVSESFKKEHEEVNLIAEQFFVEMDKLRREIRELGMIHERGLQRLQRLERKLDISREILLAPRNREEELK